MQPFTVLVSPTLLSLIFYVLLLAFTVHAVVLSYHWFTYGSSRSLSLTALAIYLCGGAILLLTFSIALNVL